MSLNYRSESIFLKCLAGGIGCGCSGFVTNPMDVVKIKNQQYGGEKYGSFTGTARFLWRTEGIRSFFKGAGSSVLRELTYSSFRMGMYEPIKNLVVLMTGNQESSPAVKWLSAFLSGGIGSALFVPVDLVKVRFQSQLPGEPRPYRSISHAFINIYQTENGIKGLYNGTIPTVIRAAFLTCAQLGSYDVIKNNIMADQFGMDREKLTTHFSASLIASIVTTTAANPADVVKTRAMNDRTNSRKILLHFRSIWQKSGLAGYMKGWTASYLRIGPHTIISFVLIEKVRQLLGMTTY